MKVFKSVVNALFPNKCISCGTIIPDEEYLCEYCFEMIDYVDFSKICTRCGLSKKNCECKSRVYHFAGCISPFENKDIARESMYRYKFMRTPTAAKFFAKEMAKAVKIVYNEIAFDGVAYVPMHPLKQLKRGFNQSEKLAVEIAEIFDLKVYYGLLSCKYVSKSQHNMPIKERFSNVKGLYSTNYKVTGKTILLVDDIKTTGASLDECAKQLLLAGAENVYCVSGLISQAKKGKTNNGN